MAPTLSPQLTNEINITLQAQGYFQDAGTKLMQIRSAIGETQQQLVQTAMASSAGATFGNAVLQWCEDFDDVIGIVNWMAGQLGDTAQALRAGNQQSADMAAGLPGMGTFSNSWA